jgi:hypothetical protein
VLPTPLRHRRPHCRSCPTLADWLTIGRSRDRVPGPVLFMHFGQALLTARPVPASTVGHFVAELTSTSVSAQSAPARLSTAQPPTRPLRARGLIAVTSTFAPRRSAERRGVFNSD